MNFMKENQLNIKLLIILAVLAIAAVAGWQYYKHQQKKEIDLASNAYEIMLGAAKQKDWRRAETQAKYIKDRYSSTNYAALSALLLAKIALEQNNNDRAIENFQFVIKADEKGHLGQIAALRLTRLLISEGKYKEALETLNASSLEEAYASLSQELKGDIYLKQNDIEKARIAYQTAIQSAPPGIPLTALQLKYSDIRNDGEVK